MNRFGFVDGFRRCPVPSARWRTGERSTRRASAGPVVLTLVLGGSHRSLSQSWARDGSRCAQRPIGACRGSAVAGGRSAAAPPSIEIDPRGPSRTDGIARRSRDHAVRMSIDRTASPSSSPLRRFRSSDADPDCDRAVVDLRGRGTVLPDWAEGASFRKRLRHRVMRDSPPGGAPRAPRTPRRGGRESGSSPEGLFSSLQLGTDFPIFVRSKQIRRSPGSRSGGGQPCGAPWRPSARFGVRPVPGDRRFPHR